MKGGEGMGDTWTWVAIDSPTKLIPYWFVGDRSLTGAQFSITDLAGRRRADEYWLKWLT